MHEGQLFPASVEGWDHLFWVQEDSSPMGVRTTSLAGAYNEGQSQLSMALWFHDFIGWHRATDNNTDPSCIWTQRPSSGVQLEALDLKGVFWTKAQIYLDFQWNDYAIEDIPFLLCSKREKRKKKWSGLDSQTAHGSFQTTNTVGLSLRHPLSGCTPHMGFYRIFWREKETSVLFPFLKWNSV